MDDDTKGFSDAPPSYDDSIQHPGGGTSPQDASGPESATRHLQNHIASLPGRIRASQRARTAQQRLDDTLLVDHIAPAIEELLIDLGAQGGTVTPLATLTIVPDGAIPPKAELSGLSEMRSRGELGRVSKIRLSDHDKREEKDGEEKDGPPAFSKFTFASAASSSLPFSSPDYSATDLLWWRDEAMARRLADCLQPKVATTGKRPQAERIPSSTSAVQAAVEKEVPSEKQRRGWGWGKWRNGRGDPPQGAGARAATEATVSPGLQQEQQKAQGGDGACMIVEAQEVAFRVENDLGIWESIRGWGIVVTVTVDAS
ncbi:hypothetical protein SLS62_005420 [Diatrype stigma]|uniref:Uncharacterized protein n=1 Tax=Diatrype stigma TaxID=117547 RepID=A0AAN9URG0_9PEZI